jgi:hypothetical protein
MRTRKNYKKRRSVKKGGAEEDELDLLEMGKPSTLEPIKNIPPDPERFSEFEKDQVQRSLSTPVTPKEVEEVFSNPTPEERENLEKKEMFNEDPMYADSFDNEQLTIWGNNSQSQGGRKRKTRKIRKSRRLRKSRHNKRSRSRRHRRK